MIEEYPLERWNGGKVRHIVKDKIILMERGQVFIIEGHTFFTFGGASSRDISGGILDRNSYTYRSDYKTALRSGKPFRILNESWWRQELPNQTELEEGINNLEKAGYRVDYVISHCGSNRLQKVSKQYYDKVGLSIYYNHDILTDYFEELEDKLQYKKWFCGHYHKDVCIDEKHIILYHKFVQVESSV